MLDNKRKKIKTFAVVVCISVILECLVFNFDFFYLRYIQKLECNVTLTESDFSKVNWEIKDGGMVTGNDAQLIYTCDEKYVKNLQIEYIASEHIDVISIFGLCDGDAMTILKTEQTAGGDKTGKNKNEVVVDLNENITGLRIDMGEAPNVEVTEFRVVLNTASFSFSWSRFIAMLVIYYVSVFLFSLQKTPDYGIME